MPARPAEAPTAETAEVVSSWTCCAWTTEGGLVTGIVKLVGTGVGGGRVVDVVLVVDVDDGDGAVAGGAVEDVVVELVVVIVVSFVGSRVVFVVSAVVLVSSVVFETSVTFSVVFGASVVFEISVTFSVVFGASVVALVSLKRVIVRVIVLVRGKTQRVGPSLT